MGKKKVKSKGSKQTNILSGTAGKCEKLPRLNDDMDIIASALSTANQVVFIKVCRLCESKDGPFLNIFEADKIIARKIEELMPFSVAENDDLPHKICFRCSVKVEELYEFIQKCIDTQHNLHKSSGKKEVVVIKPMARTIWEEKLNKSNMSNDDICDALIKKAMEGINDIPLSTLPPKDEKPTLKKETKPSTPSLPQATKKETSNTVRQTRNGNESDQSLKDDKKKINTTNESKFIRTRVSRSKNATENLLDGLQDVKRKKLPNKPNDNKGNEPQEECLVEKTAKKNMCINNLSFDYDDEPIIKTKPIESTSDRSKESTPKEVVDKKPFDIMDHVCMIKVNGVGILFQCKLCNRNFLKKELILSHGCAKTGVPKADFTKKFIPPAPPKASVVKYITTKVDSEPIKPPLENIKPPLENIKPLLENIKPPLENIKPPLENKPEVETKKTTVDKPKPKIGPASRVKRKETDHNSVIGMTVVPMAIESATTSKSDPTPSTPIIENNSNPAPSAIPSVQFPTIPSLNSRYKLVPGPNNTFQLVEESPNNLEPEVEVTVENNTKTGKKRKSDPPKAAEAKSRKQNSDNSKNKVKAPVSEVIDLDAQQPATISGTNNQPYPVGLFQTLPHHSAVYTPQVATVPTFTTPGMKKQSYTVVQTGNPSKLLISTKPQPVAEELPKKRSKKTKAENRQDTVAKQPFSVTLEETAPPKDTGYFTFINVDPLLQPSYVLPTDNIIQESQISTSTSAANSAIENKEKEKEKYSCNMCGEAFSREKKLLAHIQSHYNKMDEEDQLRNTKKRSGKKH